MFEVAFWFDRQELFTKAGDLSLAAEAYDNEYSDGARLSQSTPIQQ